MDVGALTPSLGLRGTRKANEFYERVSVLVCIQLTLGQAEWLTIPLGLLKDIMNSYYLSQETYRIEELLNTNRIFKERFKYR